MNLIKDRIFLGAIAVILTFFNIFFLSHIEYLNANSLAYLNLTSAHLIFFNLIIAASWLAFGWIGGALSFAIAIIAALSLFIISGSCIYCIHIIIFFVTLIYSFRFLKAFVDFCTEHALKREKIYEQKNILSERLQKDNLQIEASKLKLKRYEELKNVAENIREIFSLEEIARFLTEKAFEIVGKSERALLYLADPVKRELVLTYSKKPADSAKIKKKKGDMFDKWVLRQNQPLIVLDAAKDFRFSHEDILEEIDFKSLIAIPMISHNKMMGLMRLDSKESDAYNPDDLRLLDIIGDLGAVALHNNILYKRTTELAIRDGLTQLFVHRYFMERLNNEVQRALKKGHHLSVLMIDIDHFKEYNDKYGHIAGDILLKHLTHIFTSKINMGDIAARYGGEEFALILFGSDKDSSKDTAEGIRTAVENNDFYLRREKTHATVSIGVSTLPDDARTSEDLLKSADMNLYQAKKKGRNRVWAA